MTEAFIGISLGFIVIFLFEILKQFDKRIIYGLVLTGIGFLYVGFVWTSRQELIINIMQAVLFFIIAYYGTKGNINLLATGFFLHGCWDILYPFWRAPGLIPPNYELFCLSIDFVMGLYILVFKKKFTVKSSIT